MEELYNLNLSENTIKSMLELNPNIKNISNNEIIEKEILLENIGCTHGMIRNIISSNSLFLSANNKEILLLFKTLYTYSFDTLNILIDSNPYILNVNPTDLENYIKKRIQNGESLEDIVDELDGNPLIFNEL